jgi:hypothetical protein
MSVKEYSAMQPSFAAELTEKLQTTFSYSSSGAALMDE